MRRKDIWLIIIIVVTIALIIGSNVYYLQVQQDDKEITQEL